MPLMQVQTTQEGIRVNLLLAHLSQHQPAVIPALDALGVCNDHPFRLLQALGTERISFSQATQLAQQVIRVDVAGPRLRHSVGHVRRRAAGEHTLDASQLNNRVDPVGENGPE